MLSQKGILPQVLIEASLFGLETLRVYSSYGLQLIINAEALQGRVLSPIFCVYKQPYNLRPV